MAYFSRYSTVGLTVLACVVACSTESTGSSEGTGSGCVATIASIQEKIFAPKCATAGCHTSSRPASGLDLASPGVDARLVGVPSTCPGSLLVAPGDPKASLIVDKLTNPKPACGGSRMPLGGTIADDEVACITDWIASLTSGSTSDGGPTIDAGPTVSCAVGETACGDQCRKTLTDPTNCGACGNACTGGAKFCVDGACSASCPLTECSGACVDTKTDASNCGACGNACTGGKVCVNGSCSCGTNPVTLSTIQSAIFTPSCTGGGCHAKVGMKQPAEGLDLSSAAAAHQTLVGKTSSTCGGKTRVVAGDPSASYLMNKLTGVGLCNGSRMPKGGSLTAAEIDSVRNWICNGAQMN